jgi:hypothetical protein
LAAAEQLVQRAANNVDVVAALAHKARLAKARGNADEAKRLATEAIAGLSVETPRETMRLLATNLMCLERFADALPILQQLAVPGVTDESGRRLVDCAMRVERYDVVLDYCAKARDSGVFDGFLLEREISLLEYTAPSKAIEILQGIVKRDSTEHAAQVQLVLIACRESRPDLLGEYSARLPSVEVVDAWEGEAVVHVLQTIGREDEARAYSYDLLRRYFSDHRTHRAFLNVHVFHRPENVVVELNTVVPGAAVQLKEIGDAEGNWYVLEDSKVPASGVPEEVDTDSQFARLLMGKHVGEEVMLTQGPGVERKLVVTAIVPKAVHRFRDVVHQWQIRFPENQEIRIGRTETVDGVPNVQPLVEMFEGFRRRTEEVLRNYRQHEMPLHLLAEAWAIGEVDTLWQLAHLNNAPIRCSYGTMREVQSADAAFRMANEVVVDWSAIASAALLGCLEDLRSIGKRLVLSVSTRRMVRGLAESSRFPLGWAESLGKEWNGANLFGSKLQQQDERIAFFARLIEFCETDCQVQESTAVTQLSPELRNSLGETVGWLGLESLVLAREPGRILWSDDGGAVAIAGLLGIEVRRTWTQMVFRGMNQRGTMGVARFNELSAKLIGSEYWHTVFNGDVFRECAKMADWKHDRWPLRQANERLGPAGYGWMRADRRPVAR